MLFLVATPIGNLGDFSDRAKEILRTVDYILCEDTRRSRQLLNHFLIKTALRSYHLFSETKQQEAILSDLRAGKSIALISDAGTPAINDPGEQLVRACRQEGLNITAIPGPSSLLTALCSSGLPTTPFQFTGFLPKQANALKQALLDILSYQGTTICFESPKRLTTTLAKLEEMEPQRPIVIARELTKVFEEVRTGTTSQLLEHFRAHPPRGECILLISPEGSEKKETWQQLTPREHVEQLMLQYGLSKMEAIKMAAKMRGTPKSAIYDETL